MSGYGQFCPVAKAAEILDERWTLLVIRELLHGARRFNDIRRGVPRMSPSLLSRRLKDLTGAGVVDRVTSSGGVEYVLTPAGEELRPIVDGMGAWGIRWMPQLGDEDHDPHLLLWAMHSRIDLTQTPNHRVVVHFRFGDLKGKDRDWWMVIEPDGVDVCDIDPGFDVDLQLGCELSTLVRVWRGDIEWKEAVRADHLSLEGASRLVRAFPGWLELSPFASVERPKLEGNLSA
jgi:DNA-binding HxlR family transcriptional regulator